MTLVPSSPSAPEGQQAPPPRCVRLVAVTPQRARSLPLTSGTASVALDLTPYIEMTNLTQRRSHAPWSPPGMGGHHAFEGGVTVVGIRNANR
jgi:hypothetical protein